MIRKDNGFNDPMIIPALVRPEITRQIITHKPIDQKDITCPEHLMNVVIDYCNDELLDILYSDMKIRTIYKIDLDLFKAEMRDQGLVLARAVFYYFCRRLFATKYKVLGEYAGGKDHSTVMHGIKKLNNMMDTMPMMKAALVKFGKSIHVRVE